MATITANVTNGWETLTNIIKTRKSDFAIDPDTTYEIQNVGGGNEVQFYEGATSPDINEVGSVVARLSSVLYKEKSGEVLYIKAKTGSSAITLVIG